MKVYKIVQLFMFSLSTWGNTSFAANSATLNGQVVEASGIYSEFLGLNCNAKIGGSKSLDGSLLSFSVGVRGEYFQTGEILIRKSHITVFERLFFEAGAYSALRDENQEVVARRAIRLKEKTDGTVLVYFSSSNWSNMQMSKDINYNGSYVCRLIK